MDDWSVKRNPGLHPTFLRMKPGGDVLGTVMLIPSMVTLAQFPIYDRNERITYLPSTLALHIHVLTSGSFQDRVKNAQKCKQKQALLRKRLQV